MRKKELSSYKNLNVNASPSKTAKRNKTIRNSVIAVFSVLLLLVGSGLVYVDYMLNRIQFFNPIEDPSSAQTASTGSSPTGTPAGAAGMIGGLYHDDQITNVLLLGVDDYQKNDVGRSDSMMLISLDKRHQKLKMTSVMRDTYVAIPGGSSGRINEAYTRGYIKGGPAEGGRSAVATIEANFGVDIDRFVLISNSAFDQIIEKLGGVDITLTAGEAKLINQNSGDKRRNLKAGTYTLSGKQAHYYSRIRAIGDDFERTQRQRNVVTSLVEKFKNSNIGTINNMLYECLNLVQTNMTKNEILYLAANSLTYMNYENAQLRIPGDNQYDSVRVNGADVLVPRRKECSEALQTFIFEDDLPQTSSSGSN